MALSMCERNALVKLEGSVIPPCIVTLAEPALGKIRESPVPVRDG